jgi:tetratricopeptide (TPR) repeat protein
MKKLLYSILLVSFSLMVWAEETPIEKANQLYQKGEFQKAIDTYEMVLSSHIEAPELYFNLGNAYYKTGQIAPAILNYERAKLLAPNDKDIKYNLKLARQSVLDKLEVLPDIFYKRWISGIRNAFHADVWAYFSISLFILSLLFACFYLYSNRSLLKKLGFFFAIIALGFSALTYSFSSEKSKDITIREHAIIFTPSVTVKGSPDDSGTDLFVLHEGTKVKVLESIGDWNNIELSDGNTGWLKKNDIEMI